MAAIAPVARPRLPAATLAVVQLVSALVMYGKVPGVYGPSWLGSLHRWSGRMAFLLTVPVAVHCLYALGFATFDTRTLVHSLAELSAVTVALEASEDGTELVMHTIATV